MYKHVLKCSSASGCNIDKLQHRDMILFPVSQKKFLYDKFLSGGCLFVYIRKHYDDDTIEGMKLKNSSQPVYCRIMDFVEEENVIVPDWMMSSCGLKEDDDITVAEVKLLEGKSVLFEPHNKDMMMSLDGLDICEVFSPLISNYATLTKGTTISIKLLGKEWKINIKELTDINDKKRKGVCVMNTDLETDFLPALDDIPVIPEQMFTTEPAVKFAQKEVIQESLQFFDKERTPNSQNGILSQTPVQETTPFSGKGRTLNSQESTKTNHLLPPAPPQETERELMRNRMLEAAERRLNAKKTLENESNEE